MLSEHPVSVQELNFTKILENKFCFSILHMGDIETRVR